MACQIAAGKPFVTFDKEEFERQMATALDNLGITTKAQLTAAIAGATQAQINGFVKALASCLDVTVVP